MSASRTRVRLLAALALAVGVGLAWMGFQGAPQGWLALNALALLLACGLAWLPLPRVRPVLPATALLALLLWSIVPDVPQALAGGSLPAGIHRWIAFGPLRLHAALLALPALAVFCARMAPGPRAAFVAAAAAIIALQPDRSAALALLLAVIAIVRVPRKPADALALLAAALALAVTLLRPDPLSPVRFVEGVLQAGLAAGPLWGAAVLISLTVAVAAPAAMHRKPAGLAASACLAGFALASWFGPYPVPLIGYGASAILGYGLAVAALLNGRAARC